MSLAGGKVVSRFTGLASNGGAEPPDITPVPGAFEEEAFVITNILLSEALNHLPSLLEPLVPRLGNTN